MEPTIGLEAGRAFGTTLRFADNNSFSTRDSLRAVRACLAVRLSVS